MIQDNTLPGSLENTLAGFDSWIDICEQRCEQSPQGVAYAFVGADGCKTSELTYAELDQKARAIAAMLEERGLCGERALLLHPPSLDFIAAFFGCLYAGVVAVPTFPPRSASNRRLVDRLRAVIGDCGPRIALGSERQRSSVQATLATVATEHALEFVSTDLVSDTLAAQWQRRDPDPTELSSLQYTSGSTGAPKGVMLSHANLLANSALIQSAFQHDASSVGVSWLPPYHDMGLVGGVLQPMYVGFPVYLMDPSTFLKRPIAWLQTISRVRATTSGGPNFAYDWCIERVSDEEKRALDLTSWRVAFNGAETVNQETLDRFSQAFAGCGFRANAHYPCYGLAEHTLMVSGGAVDAPYSALEVKARSLIEGRVEPIATLSSDETSDRSHLLRRKTVVGCGAAIDVDRLAIVDPERHVGCDDNTVGEIWVAGNSVTSGYWGVDSSDAFEQARVDDDQHRYLRTGDLGFVHEGEIYVVGRIKDQIKLRGLNYDPLDIELTAANAHPALTGVPGAAFAAAVDDSDVAVLVHEVRRDQRGADLDSIIQAVIEHVTEQHELALHAVLLLSPGKCPRTPGGKIQRNAARGLFENDGFESLAEWRRESTPSRPDPDVATRTDALDETLQGWLIARVADAVELPVDDIDPSDSFMRYGLDSLSAVRIALEIQETYGVELPETTFLDYPTVNDLAQFVTRCIAQNEAERQ